MVFHGFSMVFPWFSIPGSKPAARLPGPGDLSGKGPDDPSRPSKKERMLWHKWISSIFCLHELHIYIYVHIYIDIYTLWLFNIAMENGPFKIWIYDDLPIKNADFPYSYVK
jgi:hypothetical protein